MMNKLILLSVFLILTSVSFSQTNASDISSIDYFYGAWYEPNNESSSGNGFIFSPDSCCNLIVDGNIIDCFNETNQSKVIYKVDFLTSPMQIDIHFVDLKTDSIISKILMVFEIIDQDNFRFAVNKELNSQRPINFNKNESEIEISTLTRYIENENNGR